MYSSLQVLLSISIHVDEYEKEDILYMKGILMGVCLNHENYMFDWSLYFFEYIYLQPNYKIHKLKGIYLK